jgi:Cu2+-exporting ATPase
MELEGHAHHLREPLRSAQRVRAQPKRTVVYGASDVARAMQSAAVVLAPSTSFAPTRSVAHDALVDCAHCGSKIASALSTCDAQGARYCCAGCAAVGALLRGAGLERYYALRGSAEAPVTLVDPARRDLSWLEPLTARFALSGVHHVALDIQGVHCAACVWVIEELFRRSASAVRVVVDPAVGRVDVWAREGFALEAFVREVERLGYLFGPALKRGDETADALLVRTAITVALAMNAMTFALALYFGLADGVVAEVARTLELVLAILAVAAGAPPFLSSAWSGLRRGVFSLDVPIALGIVLAGASTLVSALGAGDASYADTLAVFVALMLVGRWLAERAIRRDRERLLADPGADGLFSRRLEHGEHRLVRCSAIVRGDSLVVGPGEVVPVAATLDAPASFALDWISGEPEPRQFAAGASVPAGAIHVDAELASLTAQEDFGTSALRALLSSPARAGTDASEGFWGRVARTYVGLVLGAALLSFAGWWLATGDVARGLDVATALLVVTCPCGLGIATPLAYTLTQSALARGGLFLRRSVALDRALDVRRVVFDKTGTLTTARPALASTAPLDALSADDRAALASLARASGHPASAAVQDALRSVVGTSLHDLREVAGCGIEARRVRSDQVSTLRLGRGDWAVPTDPEVPGDALVFAIDDAPRAVLRLSETLREDARRELEQLRALGLELRILSGDAPARVAKVAAAVGIDACRAEGGATPDDKAQRIAELDHHDTLFVGDGLNDAHALETAWLSGTPSIDRPFVPSRADFYFVTPGLAPIRALLVAARRLRRVAHGNLVFAALYNTLAVGLAVSGVMQPWLAAIAMPLSSIVVVGITRARLGESPWKH